MRHILHSPFDVRGSVATDDQKRIALTHLSEAWEEARLDGVELECIVQAAVFLLFSELAEHYGEEAAGRFAEEIAPRVRNGEFSILPVRQ
jgi:hypothetical protein